MNPRNLIIAAVAAAAAVFLLVRFLGGDAEQTASTGGAGVNAIPIAAVGPVTGQYASFGEQLVRGAEAAVKDLNAVGGLLGREVALEIGDDACDPKQAVAVANDLASKGTALVVGHFCSGSSIPASDVYYEEEIIQISPASTNPQLTDRGLFNVFRTCGRDDQQGLAAGTFLAENHSDSRIAVIHDKTTYGKGLADATKLVLNQLGVDEVLYEAYTAGEKDYSALVSKLKLEEIDVLYIGGYHTEAGLIVRQMREQGLDTLLMSGDALVGEEYWSITGEAGQGTLMTFTPDPRRNPEAADIVAQFREQGFEPEGYTLLTYAAVQAWSQAAEHAGSLDPGAVAAALRSRSFDTVIGSISFDEKGDVTAPGYVLYEWRDGRYDYYEN